MNRESSRDSNLLLLSVKQGDESLLQLAASGSVSAEFRRHAIDAIADVIEVEAHGYCLDGVCSPLKHEPEIIVLLVSFDHPGKRRMQVVQKSRKLRPGLVWGYALPLERLTKLAFADVLIRNPLLAH